MWADYAFGTVAFRIEVDGASRRVRSSSTCRDGWTNEESTRGWIEGEEAELGMLVEWLEHRAMR